MGQQQLLLVILVVILVGIATVVAMNVFGGAADQANRDAVRQDLLQGASSAQAIWTRPEMLDGAGQNFTIFGEDELFERLNMPITEDGGTWSNENGTYTIADADINASDLVIVGAPASGDPDIHAVLCRDDDGNWQVDVGDEDDVTGVGTLCPTAAE